MINFYVINSVTRKIVKESGCASKEQAKLIRDKYNAGSGHITYCVTRNCTNEASKPPHGRPCSGRTLNVFSTEI